jgi:hypothetical protein
MYRTRNFYQAAYLMTVMDAPIPACEGRDRDVTFVFPDETGELAWAAEGFYQDATVSSFCNSLKKLRRLISETEKGGTRGH